MARLGGWSRFGTDAIDETEEKELFWGGDQNKGLVVTQSARYSGTIRDSLNTPTTVIRAGMLVAKETATGALKEWDGNATDGTQDLIGVLPVEIRAQDFDGNNAWRTAPVIVRAPLKASELLIKGNAFIGYREEFQARASLHAAGSILDDDPQGFKAGLGQRFRLVTTATHTPSEEENGATFFYTNAASVTVTLPEAKPSLFFNLVRGVDEEFIVASAEGDNVIVGNDTVADGVTFTTTGQQVGAWVRVHCVYFGSAIRWHMALPQIPFGTDGTGFTYSIQT